MTILQNGCISQRGNFLDQVQVGAGHLRQCLMILSPIFSGDAKDGHEIMVMV